MCWKTLEAFPGKSSCREFSSWNNTLNLSNIKQSQNLVLIRKTKEKEEKQHNIFENFKKANSSKLKVESIPKEGAAK
jgi:hypothetical protein